jgi:hypothetical protein
MCVIVEMEIDDFGDFVHPWRLAPVCRLWCSESTLVLVSRTLEQVEGEVK